MSGPELVCGLKLTHDGAVAVIRDGRLLFCTEWEKVENHIRHSALHRGADIEHEIEQCGVDPGEIGIFAVDGWASEQDGPPSVELTGHDGHRLTLPVAGYEDEAGASAAGLRPVLGDRSLLGRGTKGYVSYSHSTGHLFASYCTSPFAAQGRAALVLVWDGGMPPFLYLFRPVENTVLPVGRLTRVSGAIYPIFASHFDPFRVDRRSTDPHRRFGMEALFPVSGKAMAYAALGKPIEAAIDVMVEVAAGMPAVDTPMKCYLYSQRALRRLRPLGLSDAELLASFQDYLYRLLVKGLRAAMREHDQLSGLPLCVSGGCGLNIKWNAWLRASGLFPEVWVPPFPNDAGSAIGTACAEMVRRSGRSALSWTEFDGPSVRWDGVVPAGWSGRPCPIAGVAEILYREGEPVVVVTGRAELGPRALGHRSIIAPAVDPAMRVRLNEIKGREWYRPVAPICLEEHAAQVFDPGNSDPYMVFDHYTRSGWQERIPAVVHVDGSARLQTVGQDNQPTYRLLRDYHRLSGIPVLCNTSANAAGRGFFPDPGSAMRWGQTKYVWSADVLYTRHAG